jgi:glycosyltransferase involved in cell wall biosynthesis
LITPARDEEQFVGLTIESMIAQTLPPLRWVIVSDGSTDGTDEIVAQYQKRFSWIHLVRQPAQRDRSFAAKVDCFNAGLDVVRDLSFDAIGNLDADVSFGPDHFEFLVSKLAENPRLGVTGSPFVEHGRHYDYRFTNIEHVSGACQIFRRECFEQIGGYLPIKEGGVDWIAVTTARMKGWQTRTWTERTCLHHRPIGTSSVSRLGGLVRHGRKDHYLGGHPVWQVFRGVYQMTRPPYLVGGLCLWWGFFSSYFEIRARPVSRELIQFHRAEQMMRLRGFFRVHGREVRP